MMSEPRFGSRNSALEMMPINLMVSSISLSRNFLGSTKLKNVAAKYEKTASAGYSLLD
jgi:hypothetical protein